MDDYRVVPYHSLPKYLPLIIVYAVLTTVAVALRLWVRIKVVNSFAMDDVVLLMAQATILVQFGIVFYSCSLYTTPGSAVTEENYVMLTKLWNWIAVVYGSSQTMLKTSVGLFFYGFARTSGQRLIIILPLVTFLVFALAVVSILLLRCGLPIDAFQLMTRNDCHMNWNVVGPVLYVFTILNALTDWTFAILPIFLVFRSRKLKPQSRHAVQWLIVLAMAGSAVSVVRVAFVHEYQFRPAAWKDAIDLSLVSSSESAIGTLAISLATMKPLMKPVRGFCKRLFAMMAHQHQEEEGVKRYTKPNASLPVRADRIAMSMLTLDTVAMRGIGVLSDLSTNNSNEDASGMQSLGTDSSTFKSGTVLNTRPTNNFYELEHRALVSIHEVDIEDADYHPVERQCEEDIGGRIT